jgi:hypothetical protein
MEAHDEELRVQERAVAREDAWRRVDQRALALDPPGWLVAELGPVPTDPQERAVWRVAAAELDGYRRAYGKDHLPPAEHVGGRVTRDWPAAAPATAPTAARDGRARGSAGRRSHSERARQPLRARREPTAAEGRHRVEAGRLLGAEPRRDTPGRRRDWQPSARRWSGWPTTTATATTATAHTSAPVGMAGRCGGRRAAGLLGLAAAGCADRRGGLVARLLGRR